MGISDRKRSIESPVNINLDLNQEPKTNQFLIENNIKSGDFVSRKKSGNIFAGSKLNVEGQGIYNVKIIKGLTKFLPKATPVSEGNPPTKTPTPTPTNTVTPTITPTPIYCYNFTSPNPTYYFTDSDVNVNNVYLYGNFTGYTNGYVTNYAGRIIRLNSDLTIDTTFSGGGTGFNLVLFDGESIIEQSDGKIIATGSFTSYNGTSANRIIRLNTDGSIDPSFVYGTGFNSFTQGGAIDSNGSIVITGFFNSYNGTSAVRIIRLLSNGLVDPSFVYGSGFNNTTIDVLINPDNGMYVVGYFSSYKGIPVGSNGIVKLLSNGSVDTTFSGGTGFSPFLPVNPNNIVRIPGETSFYVAGYSTSYNGTLINRIVKLNEFGGIDTSFTGGTGFNNPVFTTDVVWGDKIFLTGTFTTYNGNSCLSGCIILNSDGSVLHSFNDSNFTNFFVNNYTVFAKSTSTGCIVPVYNYVVPTPTPTPTNTVTPTVTSTITPTPTQTVTSTVTPTPTVTNTPTLTQTPTITPTPSSSPSSGGIVQDSLFVELDATNYVSGTWTDETGNGNNATINGATWLSTDGGIFDLDGINDNISIPHVSSLSLSTTIQKTIQVWVKFDTLPAVSTQVPVFGKLSSSFAFDGYWGGLFSNGGLVRCVTNGNSTQKVSNSTLTITTGTWYLFTFISQITSTADTTKVYINETEYITNAHGSDTYSESNPLYLGYIGSGVSSLYLDGKIGACYFYTKGLNTSEISTNFNSTKSKYGL